jgi:acetyl-CoA carboxylase carboxyl transferase subunit alpha
MGIIDEIVPEPPGGAHQDPASAGAIVDSALTRHLEALCAMEGAARLDARYDKFRAMGRPGHAFIDEAPTAAVPSSSDDGQAG